MAQASLLDKLLRAVMLGVAAFDLAMGLLMLAAPRALSSLLGVPLPPEMFFVRFAGLLQAGLAAAYLVGGWRPAQYVGNVALAAVMRVLMAALLVYTGVTERLLVFTLLGVVEVPLGISHAVYAARLRRGRRARDAG